MNFQQARINMVDQQIRPFGVSDERLLQLFENIPREQFVPDAYKTFAYTDVCIPLDKQHALLPPKEQAAILQALAITANDNVMIVGDGCGYLAAVLARIAKHVYCIDPTLECANNAASILQSLNLDNVVVTAAEFGDGWAKHQPYDVIIVLAGIAYVPNDFKLYVKAKGRLFALVGEPPVMQAVIMTRAGQDRWQTATLFETDVPLVSGFEKPFAI